MTINEHQHLVVIKLYPTFLISAISVLLVEIHRTAIGGTPCRGVVGWGLVVVEFGGRAAIHFHTAAGRRRAGVSLQNLLPLNETPPASTEAFVHMKKTFTANRFQ